MRLFIAIIPPARLRHELVTSYGDAVRTPGWRFTREANLHVTLQFLGAVPDSAVAGLCRELGHVQWSTFQMTIGACRLAPDTRRPRMLWLDFVDTDACFDLVKRVRSAVGHVLDLDMDHRSFRAHITLARLKRAKRVPETQQAIAGRLRPLEKRQFRVDRFFLVESMLNPDGARYEVVASFPAADAGVRSGAGEIPSPGSWPVKGDFGE